MGAVAPPLAGQTGLSGRANVVGGAHAHKVVLVPHQYIVMKQEQCVESKCSIFFPGAPGPFFLHPPLLPFILSFLVSLLRVSRIFPSPQPQDPYQNNLWTNEFETTGGPLPFFFISLSSHTHLKVLLT